VLHLLIELHNRLIYCYAYCQKQIAQQSQRDRAAGCVSCGQKWKTGTGKQYCKDVYRSIFNHCDIIGDAVIAGVEITAPECKAGNRGRRKSMESEGFKNVFLTILTENRVMILACLAHRMDLECNVR